MDCIHCGKNANVGRAEQFKNEMISIHAKDLRVDHHLTLPYPRGSNGGIKRVEKETLRVLQSVTMEY